VPSALSDADFATQSLLRLSAYAGSWGMGSPSPTVVAQKRFVREAHVRAICGTASCGARVPGSRQAWPPRTDSPLAVSTAPTDIRASPSHRGGSTTFRSGMPCHAIA